MQTVVIVIHLIVVIFMIGLILVQRSEGGALGIGGGGGGNFMSARGQANVLTRSTTILAAVFFLTSLVLSLIARYGDSPSSILDQIGTNPNRPAPITGENIPDTGGGLLDSLPGQLPSTGVPQVPDAGQGTTGPQVPSTQ